MDFYGFYTGQIFDAHAYLGAHPGPGGTTFRVFAPSTRAVELLAPRSLREELLVLVEQALAQGDFYSF